jgi:2-dehydropantoate 2-reductase
MKILVLGAGATGGYFAGRLVQVGGDVTFLVRDRRAAQLAARGLVVKSPHGDFTVPAKFVKQPEVRPEYDLVLLTCKAYDLDAAIASIRPALGPATHVLPLLNGLAHVDRLVAEFGAARVIGGTCGIPATLTPEGDVVQLGPLQRIAYGPLPGTSPDARAKIEALHALYGKTSIEATLAKDVAQELWEKFVLLTTLAAMTCLMRGAVGDIMAADAGETLMTETLDACAGTAAAAGHAPREKTLAAFRKLLLDRASTFTASMLRDVESGNRTEGEHIVGDMLRRARAAGIDPGPLRMAHCHLQAYAARRRREGPPAD